MNNTLEAERRLARAFSRCGVTAKEAGAALCRIRDLLPESLTSEVKETKPKKPKYRFDEFK